MAELAPSGPVYQAGTLAGNPLATAAGLAVLSQVTPADYDALVAVPRVRQGTGGRGDGGGLVRRRRPGTAGRSVRRRRPERCHVPPSDYEARGGRPRTYGRFFHALLRRGVALAPGPYEVLFPGLAHDEAVLARVVEAAGETAAEVAGPSSAGRRGTGVRKSG